MENTLSSSFRDPSGFLFRSQNCLFRQINHVYKEDFELLISSGLYDTLTAKGLLIAHKEVDIQFARSQEAYKVIQPDPLTFISYPYEWCFSQLKDAALATLEIQKAAFGYGMSLKDCSAYNIQFLKGRPIFIDTLSFEKYRKGKPWIPYRQFCQHFLAPLVLMSYKDIRLNRLSQIYIDGIPLDLVVSLLPFFARFNPSIFFHLWWHARSIKAFDPQKAAWRLKRNISRLGFLGLIDSLETAVRSLKFEGQDSSWRRYYQETNYSSVAFAHKKEVVAAYLRSINPRVIWDFGANIGIFSELAAQSAECVVAFDDDASCVEAHYRNCRKNHCANILPLVVDLVNPSPALGWAHPERMSLLERSAADAILALALIHHLAIANNIPFSNIAAYLAAICKYLVIEFVPKDDSQVQQMLSVRDDIFTHYNQQNFESEFGKYFTIANRMPIKDSLRILYLMQRK